MPDLKEFRGKRNWIPDKKYGIDIQMSFKGMEAVEIN